MGPHGIFRKVAVSFVEMFSHFSFSLPSDIISWDPLGARISVSPALSDHMSTMKSCRENTIDISRVDVMY